MCVHPKPGGPFAPVSPAKTAKRRCGPRKPRRVQATGFTSTRLSWRVRRACRQLRPWWRWSQVGDGVGRGVVKVGRRVERGSHAVRPAVPTCTPAAAAPAPLHSRGGTDSPHPRHGPGASGAQLLCPCCKLSWLVPAADPPLVPALQRSLGPTLAGARPLPWTCLAAAVTCPRRARRRRRGGQPKRIHAFAAATAAALRAGPHCGIRCPVVPSCGCAQHGQAGWLLGLLALTCTGMASVR